MKSSHSKTVKQLSLQIAALWVTLPFMLLFAVSLALTKGTDATMEHVSFDMAVKLGDILQIFSVAAGGLMVLGYMKSEAKNNDSRLKWLEGEMTKQTEILTRLASGEERMNGLDRRVTLVEQRQLTTAA